jgi:predicted alpha/beta superfamily hydrolase
MQRRPFLHLAAFPLLAPLATPASAQPRPASLADPARLRLPPPLPMPGLARERQLRIYLPPSYAKSPQRRYPVLYAHDAQNLFDAATSYAGEWQLDEALDRLAAQQGVEVIAVGIDNGGAQRMTELNPWDHARFGKGEGFAYLRFVFETVKPFIDREWRTRTEAASTAMIGSSMGGLITHAALHRYRAQLGAGAVFSPAFWTAPAATELALSEPLLASQRVFLYGGGRESEDMLPQMRRMADIQMAQARQVRVVEAPAAPHNEAAWAAQLPAALQFLYPAA